ncbi:MAG: hypothetical protein M5U27_00405 [Gaiella sp.]|nr:hypothetical protein [Gaiella sp.]
MPGRSCRRASAGSALADAADAHLDAIGVAELDDPRDETNAPMLAVNRELGYRPFTRRIEWERSRPAPAADVR